MNKGPTPPKKRNDPWELLLLALVFIPIGLALMFAKHDEILTFRPAKGFQGAEVSLSPRELHFVGGTCLVLGALIVGYYFKLRRDLNK